MPVVDVFTSTIAFPDGEWGRFEPFGVNPATGAQYHCADTFETAPLGFEYDALYELPEQPDLLRERPVLCVFRDVDKLAVAGSKALFVYVSPADADSGFLKRTWNL